MSFKDWCFEVYGISGFFEGKVINRLFIPAGEICYPAPLLLQCRVYLTYYKQMKGLTLTKKSYDWLERNLKLNFVSQNQGLFNQAGFEEFKKSYFNKLGFSLSCMQQHRVPPGIHLKIDNELAKKKFIQRFAHYRPRESFYHLSKESTIQMPAKFLKYLYAGYYKSIKPIHELNDLYFHKLCLEKLLVITTALDKSLDLSYDLSLDWQQRAK